MQRRHSVLSFAWGVVAIAAAGACAQSAPVKEHGPVYGGDAASDATADTGGGDDGGGGDAEAGDDATPDDGGGGDGSGDSSAGADGGGGDAGHGSDASEAGSAPDAGGADASDAGSAPDAGDAGGFVPPTCDGVIGPGEYGDATHQDGPTKTGQTWYMTWDDTNLYVAIAAAAVSEGNVLYVAPKPADGGTGLTSGQPYDNTDIVALPFAADLVVYAKDGYDEARIASNGAWGPAMAASIQVCTDKATTREEVIPWSLLGGRPASFGWLGYLAANPNNNPQGYVYGQMPTDDPGGTPAGNLTYTKYFAVPDATPGVDAPFADEQ